MTAPITRLEFHFPAGTKHKAGTCMACGCTDDAACEGGCFWIDPSHLLCSVCLALALEEIDTRKPSTVTRTCDEAGDFVSLTVPLRKPKARKRR